MRGTVMKTISHSGKAIHALMKADMDDLERHRELIKVILANREKQG
jgi:hypothetical protein